MDDFERKLARTEFAKCGVAFDIDTAGNFYYRAGYVEYFRLLFAAYGIDVALIGTFKDHVLAYAAFLRNPEPGDKSVFAHTRLTTPVLRALRTREYVDRDEGTRLGKLALAIKQRRWRVIDGGKK